MAEPVRARPIIFSAESVRAILDGRKTMTRRVIKLPTKARAGYPLYEHPKMGGWEPTTVGGGGCFTVGRNGEKVPAPEQVAIWHRTCGVCIAAQYQIGDHLWVRETWKLGLADHRCAGYRADMSYQCGKPIPEGPHRWRSPIHMPRWASRLTLEVTAVRIEQVQEISEEDAGAEGCSSHGLNLTVAPGGILPCIAFYRDTWQSLHGPGSWEANPWVCAVSFRRATQEPTDDD